MGPFDRTQVPTRLALNPAVHGYDTAYWKTISGTPSVSSGAFRFSNAEAQSMKTYLFGTFHFDVTIPHEPTEGDASAWGFAFHKTKNAAYFSIVDGVLSCVSYDFAGNKFETVLAWSEDYLNPTAYEVTWGPTSDDGRGNKVGTLIFSIAGTVVANHHTCIPDVPASILISHLEVSNFDVFSVVVASEFEYLPVAPVSLTGATVSVDITKTNEISNYVMASDETDHGQVACDTTAGGTQVLPANSNRSFAQMVNKGAVTGYFGTGTVTSSYNPVEAGQPFTWHSKEAMKFLSSSGSCNVSFCDYSKT